MGEPIYTDVLAAAPQGGRFRRFRLDVVEGPDRGLSLRLERGSVLVGTAPESDLCLSDTAVSRTHARMVPMTDGIEVTDLGSKNGIFVLGNRIQQGKLAPGSELVLGRSRIRIVPEDELSIEPSERTEFGRLKGSSLTMRRFFAVLEHAASTTGPVLLEGEAGAGKLFTARSIHETSPQKVRPFHVVDAYVDFAIARAFEDAGSGTLVIRNIDRIEENQAVRLLAILETNAVPTRVIATTRADLEAKVAKGDFNPSLFVRLAALRIRVPPLRERSADLPLLILDILRELDRPAFTLGPSELGKLQAYAWPENIRELRAVIERAASLGGGEAATPASAAGPPDEGSIVGADLPYKEARAQLLEAFEREYVRALLERNEGNVSRAARAAGIDRVYLHRLIRKYEL